ncbi:transcriptional regulator, TetR family [Nocardia amikacinitolerans]|uniref:TetR/AcrR family transcriptional regulator n=1 Tax=Nocardia amikacinitolerans TaxID=756689 RepID=UPI000833486C|nr:TetR family transcriptional regulator [Nocardia amikacinitolerans]MCP2319259.1 transcriptional regulator, TetR family [Nocardia amikacinitolerans]
MFDKQATTRTSARPAPVQRRGIERVHAILDAAETLLGEQGYEAATLKAIGERAGIPIASVYHYFADRHQVDAELVRRHVSALDERLTAALDHAEARTLREACDSVVDMLLAYYREHPSFVELWYRGRNSTLSVMAREFDVSQAEQLWRYLLERDLIRADTPRFVLELAYEAGDRLFDVAFRRSPSGDAATIDEARRLVTAYLETYASKG